MNSCHPAVALVFLFSAGFAFGQQNLTHFSASSTTQSHHKGTVSMSSTSKSLEMFHEQQNQGIDVACLKSRIDLTMAEAISNRETPGGIVLVMRNGVTLLHSAYGIKSSAPGEQAATQDTIYDLASLTKPIATASSIMLLIEQGKLRLDDRISSRLPEWKNSDPEQEKANLLGKLNVAIKEGKLRAAEGRWDSADSETAELAAKVLSQIPDLESISSVEGGFDLRPRDRESITIRHLLTHTSGLPPFFRYYEMFPEGNAREKILADIAQTELRGPVGGQFIYSDLGYILLAEVVERVGGLPLDQFATKNIFGPLRMKDTMFTPPDALRPRIAPTEWTAGEGTNLDETTRTMLCGTVHDGNARIQNGVSGHAGLFSTAHDLSIFLQMLMDGGAIRDVSENQETRRIFSPLTVAAMTRDHAGLGPGEAKRGLGWDISSSYSSQKGDLFASGYGHTGFTGTSIWVVPEEKLAIIILTNRVHPDGKGNVTPLRAKIANIVAGCITDSYKNQSPEINQ